MCNFCVDRKCYEISFVRDSNDAKGNFRKQLNRDLLNLTDGEFFE